MADKRAHKVIRGAGGGKGGGGGATIAPDSITSHSYAKVAIAICEGEVEGLVGGMKGVLLDGVPLQNADNSYNFSGISFNFLPGTQTQDWVPGFSDVENEISVAAIVHYGTPLVRTISDPNANQVRVIINIPQMQSQSLSNGDVSGSNFTFAIDVQTNGGGFVQVHYQTFAAKISSNVEQATIVNLNGTGPWDIRVRRVNPDSALSNVVNAFYWTSLTEIINVKLTYPNTAVAYINVDSSQFQSIPTVACHMRGMIVRVPSNYDPNGRTYAGPWDGTFKLAYTNNPAWCFYDLLTATRYGLGNYISASQVDKWALYTIGQYCDALVPDGMGGQEPRFTLNCYIQNYADAFQVVQDLASCFRGMPFWASGSVTAVQDASALPTALFTNANVINGDFTYTGASLKTRHSVALVTWYNMQDQAKPYVEYVSNDPMVAKYGEIITQVTAFGCTSRGQAIRVGKWILFSEQYLGETVAFKTAIEGSPVRPGQVIKIADVVRGGQRMGGRVSAGSSNSVTVDTPLLNNLNVPYALAGNTITIMGLNGAVCQSTITSSPIVGGVQTINVSPNFTYAPQPQSMWVIELPTIEAQEFRVLQVTQSDRSEFEIVATEYNSSIYNLVDDGTAFVPLQISDLTLPLNPPTNVICVESLYSYQSTIYSMAAISWTPVDNANAYYIGWQKDGGNWQYDTTPVSEYDLQKTNPGSYVFKVWSIGPSQKKSTSYGSLTTTLYGKFLPPSDIVGLDYGFDPANGLILNWAMAPDIDVYSYEVRRGSSWASGIVVNQPKVTSLTVGVANTGGQIFWVAVLDTQGVYSMHPQSIAPVFAPIPAPTVHATLAGVNAVISWGAVIGSLNIDHYEIRTDLNWGNPVNLVGTVKGTTITVKANFSGTLNFYVRAVDLAGNVSPAGNVTVTINVPSAPVITQQVIDNNVLLKWTASVSTLPIDHYAVSKGVTFAGSTVIGNISGTFDVIFETARGMFTYWICGVDAAGNFGTPTGITVNVDAPPNYILHYNLDSTFSGVRTNIATDTDGTIIAPIDVTTSWQSHFTSKSWTSPQDQVNAGYPLYVEPALLTATYVESIDYGALLPPSNIVVTPSNLVISGSPTLSVSIAVSADGSTYTNYPNTQNVFVQAFRYAKITISITGTSGLDIMRLTGLNIKYQIKQKSDSGVAACLASDAGGTVVHFNIAFIDVTALNGTANGTGAAFCVCNFADVADPTSFTIELFDTDGNRLDGNASWTADGV